MSYNTDWLDIGGLVNIALKICMDLARALPRSEFTSLGADSFESCWKHIVLDPPKIAGREIIWEWR